MSLSELITTSKRGINEIKLRKLLSIREESNGSPLIKTMFPPIGMGSITLVDQIVLLTLAKILEPKKIVEVGTFLGFTTALLAMNTDAKIFTIDLPTSENVIDLEYDETLIEVDGNENDNFLRKKQVLNGEVYLQNLSKEERQRVVLSKADSTSINFLNEFGDVNFVFIDGGHEKSIVETDTFNARSIVNDGVIIWHDFGSNIHNDVTQYLIKEKDRKIFHVKNSLCAFEFITS